jgi:hypothetical protein
MVVNYIGSTRNLSGRNFCFNYEFLGSGVNDDLCWPTNKGSDLNSIYPICPKKLQVPSG